MRQAIIVLVDRFPKVGVQPTIVAMGQFCGLPHQGFGDCEWRTRRQRHLQERSLRRIVIGRQDPFAIGQDRILVLHDAVGWQSAILDADAHGPPG